jgi:AcrR family transcriptional regulator
VSDAPTSIWTRPERGTRGPAPSHSRDEIVAAAITLADAEGLPAVSMRAVATALGTTAGSLYRYLSSRDDLLDLMTDRTVAELRPYPERPGDWLDGMLLVAQAQRSLYRRHPWLVELSTRPTGVGPEALAWFDNCLGVLAPVKVAATAKFEAIAMMTGVVSLFARSEASTPALPVGPGDLAAYPHLMAALTSATAPPPRKGDLFERALRSLLTGLLTG